MINTFSDDTIICPYCGAETKVDFETFTGDELDTEENMYCEECDHEFTASRTCVFNYETFKAE